MVGLDTLNMWLGVEKVGYINLLNAIPHYLDANTVVYQQRADGRESYIGHINNYRVVVYESGISLSGSLPKSYLGSNVKPLDYKETALALESLSDQLHIPLGKSIVRRFDFADTFVMERPVKNYLEYLGNSRYYNRLEQPKSILWSNGRRQKMVYDKGDECKHHKSSIPVSYQNKHLLRYEIRYVSDLPKHFNAVEVTPRTLCNQDFCHNICCQWVAEYKCITKIQKMIFSTTPKTPKIFSNQLTLAGIESMGGYMAVNDLVDQIRKNGGFAQPEHSSRIKHRLETLMQSSSLAIPSELITELDKKIVIH